MKSYRIKGTILAVLLAATAIPQTTVYAGSLNANEQQLLAYASGTFEYEGHTYKATSAALAMARAKLCEDGIDLTDSQLSKAYAQADSYIGTAVYNGYLVRTDWGNGGSTEQKPSSKPTDKPENDETNNSQGNKPSDTEGSNTQGNSSQENGKGDQTTSDNKANVTTDGHDKYYTNEDKKTEQGSSKDNTEDTVTIEKYLEGTVSVTNGEDVIFESTLPVKNTGFTIKNSLLTIGALGGILILSVFESMKLLRFARGKDE